MAIKSYKEWVLCKESDHNDTIQLPPFTQSLRTARSIPDDGRWSDYGPTPPSEPSEDDDSIIPGGHKPTPPEAMTNRHPLIRLWRLLMQVDPHLDDRNARGLANLGANGSIDYMAPEVGAAALPTPQFQQYAEPSAVLDQYQKAMNAAARYLPWAPRREMGRALREWLNFKKLVRQIMVQVGRIVDESHIPNMLDARPRQLIGWKSTLLQLRYCDGVFQRIQQFINQHNDLEELFANPFQHFMSVHTPIYRTLTAGLQELVNSH